MWVIMILGLSLIIIPSKLPTPSFARDPFYSIPCVHHDDCGHSTTHLRCLRKGATKICECQNLSHYDHSQRKCFLALDQACDLHVGPKCHFGLFCKANLDSFGNLIEEGICTFCQHGSCGSSSSSSTSTEKQSESLTSLTNSNVFENILGRSCTTKDQTETCQTFKTFLRCLKDDKGVSKCTCGRVGIFDEKQQKCVLQLGARCQVPSKQEPNPQECVNHGTCIPDKDIYGNTIEEGVCCHSKYIKVCNEFDPIKPTLEQSKLEQKDLLGQSCSVHEDCDQENTYLRCIVNSNGLGKVCHCGRNNFYFDKKCFLGIGQECSKPVYYSKNPSQCAQHGSCTYHKDKQGKEMDQGTCTCRPNNKHEQCQEVKVEPDFGIAFGKLCKTPSDCEQGQNNFLKCLTTGKNGHKICTCGHNSVYDKSVKKCFLGIGQQCQVDGKGAQECMNNAICSSQGQRMKSHGIGTCVCRNGLVDCDAFITISPVVDKMKVSSSIGFQSSLNRILLVLIMMHIFIL